MYLIAHVWCVSDGESDQTSYDLLHSCKNMCQQKRPEVSRTLENSISCFARFIQLQRMKFESYTKNNINWIMIKNSSEKMMRHHIIRFFCYHETGACRDGSSRREGQGGNHCWGSKASKGLTAGSWTAKAIVPKATTHDLGKQKEGEQVRGLLHPECQLYDNCSKKETQELRRIFDHHQTS